MFLLVRQQDVAQSLSHPQNPVQERTQFHKAADTRRMQTSTRRLNLPSIVKGLDNPEPTNPGDLQFLGGHIVVTRTLQTSTEVMLFFPASKPSPTSRSNPQQSVKG